ncbi:MAG: undecaprenyl-diphosphate phosphatase [Oscillospiraceae bacterium]|nr:undecaprenyl-diphosphate phosphatase [Oscillospiraceae bacterium]
MEILKAIILGIVQGATEFLPISSSGHLSVFQHFMNISGEGSLALTVFLHIGTLIAVAIVYYKTFIELIKELAFTIKDIFTGKFTLKNLTPERQMLYMMILSCVPLLLILIPVGNDMRVKDIASSFSGDNDIVLEGICFLITAALLLLGTKKAKNNKNIQDHVTPKSALLVGLAQFVAACLPGVSRSGSTISTGMLCGVDKNYMVRYSFVLGTPAVLAASLLEFKDLFSGGEVAMQPVPIIIGIIVAAVVGILSIKLLEMLVKTDRFKFFGYYCLVIGLIVVILGTIEKF